MLRSSRLTVTGWRLKKEESLRGEDDRFSALSTASRVTVMDYRPTTEHVTHNRWNARPTVTFPARRRFLANIKLCFGMHNPRPIAVGSVWQCDRSAIGLLTGE